MRWRLVAVVIVLSALGIWYLCRGSEEERIRRVLREGKEAIEREDLPRLMELISPHYSDFRGLNYFALRGFLGSLFNHYEHIRIHVEREEIALEDGKALARVWGWAEARDLKGEGVIACSSGDPCLVELQLEKEGGRWLVRSTRTPKEVPELEVLSL